MPSIQEIMTRLENVEKAVRRDNVALNKIREELRESDKSTSRVPPVPMPEPEPVDPLKDAQFREPEPAVPEPNEADPVQKDGFQDAINADLTEFSAKQVGQALLDKVCIPYGCREKVFIMEKGDSVRAQPFRLTDKYYKVLPIDRIQLVLDKTKVDEIEWEAEEYDCDDIARKLVTRCVDLGINSVGRIMSWSGEHAFCIAIVYDGDELDFVFIEPQTDEIITSLEGKYDLSNALIIIS